LQNVYLICQNQHTHSVVVVFSLGQWYLYIQKFLFFHNCISHHSLQDLRLRYNSEKVSSKIVINEMCELLINITIQLQGLLEHLAYFPSWKAHFISLMGIISSFCLEAVVWVNGVKICTIVILDLPSSESMQLRWVSC